MTQYKHTSKHITGLAVFLLGALFLVLSIGLVLLGGSMYRQITADATQNAELRTTLGYISNQVRRHDSAGNIEAGNLAGVPSIILHQDIADIPLAMYLYSYDGMLRSKLVQQGNEQDPEFGLALVPLADLLPTWTDTGLLRVEIMLEDGLSAELLLYPRSEREGGGLNAITL